MVTALTMTYAEEAIGIVRAARSAGMPVAISFTVETDGRLPSGQPLGEAIEQVDAETGGRPPTSWSTARTRRISRDALDGAAWLERIRGLRANASTKSHAELDEAEELDDGDPAELAARLRRAARAAAEPDRRSAAAAAPTTGTSTADLQRPAAPRHGVAVARSAPASYRLAMSSRKASSSSRPRRASIALQLLLLSR